MTTNYDPIAERYKRAKRQPWRTHIEAYTLNARRLRALGAAKVRGVPSRSSNA
jgi:hypothetical protein